MVRELTSPTNSSVSKTLREHSSAQDVLPLSSVEKEQHDLKIYNNILKIKPIDFQNVTDLIFDKDYR